MESFEGLELHAINPLAPFGLDYPLLYVNKDTIIYTWLALGVLLVAVLIMRYFLTKKKSIGRFIATSFVSSFMDLTTETLGGFFYQHTAFITAIFTFILLCNCIGVIPGTEEPTRDLNTTFALGIISFIYKEFYAIKAHGFLGYLKEFTHPFFVMLPLNIIGHLSKVVSLSFRLFGNIFGGSIISTVYQSVITSSVLAQIAGLVSGVNLLVLLFFGVFEGVIQAFVFSMLALTYLSIAIQPEQ